MVSSSMFTWVKRLHMYAGLLTFIAFVVWGITGIHAVFLPTVDNWEEPSPTEKRDRRHFCFSNLLILLEVLTNRSR